MFFYDGLRLCYFGRWKRGVDSPAAIAAAGPFAGPLLMQHDLLLMQQDGPTANASKTEGCCNKTYNLLFQHLFINVDGPASSKSFS